MKPIICYLHSTHRTLIYSHAILPSFYLLKALFPLTKNINKSAIRQYHVVVGVTQFLSFLELAICVILGNEYLLINHRKAWRKWVWISFNCWASHWRNWCKEPHSHCHWSASFPRSPCMFFFFVFFCAFYVFVKWPLNETQCRFQMNRVIPIIWKTRMRICNFNSCQNKRRQ